MPLDISARNAIKLEITRQIMKSPLYLVAVSFVPRWIVSLKTALASSFFVLTLYTLKSNRSFRVCGTVGDAELTRTVTLWLRSTSASMIARMLCQWLYSPGNTKTLPAWPASTPHSSRKTTKCPQIIVKYFCFWKCAVWSGERRFECSLSAMCTTGIWAKVTFHYCFVLNPPFYYIPWHFAQ